jgi:hypothetical protein
MPEIGKAASAAKTPHSRRYFAERVSGKMVPWKNFVRFSFRKASGENCIRGLFFSKSSKIVERVQVVIVIWSVAYTGADD